MVTHATALALLMALGSVGLRRSALDSPGVGSQAGAAEKWSDAGSSFAAVAGSPGANVHGVSAVLAVLMLWFCKGTSRRCLLFRSL